MKTKYKCNVTGRKKSKYTEKNMVPCYCVNPPFRTNSRGDIIIIKDNEMR